MRPRKDGTADVVDHISHLPTCDLFVRRRPQPKHLQKKKWEKQEKRANALVGARETLMSGAVNEDGDGRVFHRWRVESKRTRSDKYRLTHHVWEKLCTGAADAGEEPILHLEVASLFFVLVRDEWLSGIPDAKDDPGGHLEVNGKGVTIRSSHIRTTPMWIEGMQPTPWLLTEREFQELKRKADERGDNL
jgi:hypothetical protein